MSETLDPAKVTSHLSSHTEITDPLASKVKPVVSVLMITYNHGPYIADAIQGVLSQKTAFPVELIIGEDCSTDETREIVLDYQRRFPGSIRVILSNSNVGSAQNVKRVHEAARGCYIALCEGDDLWTDDRKLQKQVDVMECEPDCAMVCHAAEVLDVARGRVRARHHGRKPKTFSLEEVIVAQPRLMTTASILARRSVLAPIPIWLSDSEIGDYPFMILCASRGKVVCLPDVMSLYRVNVPGSWTVRSAGVEARRRTVDSILWMLDEFVRDAGKECRDAVRKAQRKVIMLRLYLNKNGHPDLPEEDRLRYKSYLTRCDKVIIALTKYYLPRRLVKIAFEVREYLRRRLAGQRAKTEGLATPQGNS
ncbi:MAG: glycosyltransferase [Deltaproteobacteria bacterium]